MVEKGFIIRTPLGKTVETNVVFEGVGTLMGVN